MTTKCHIQSGMKVILAVGLPFTAAKSGISVTDDRGIMGLYRGLGSNFATAAPISAIYTSTYESVKEFLLPCLPKKYHSVAHCVAGGCASVATSFVFTPSECVKQRLQVGGTYTNSWAALVGILQSEGLCSLYAGWGAVLCRNVPQSIIKFLTYEQLKQWAMQNNDGDRLSHLQTLAIGGTAGSTAAFFTTPFDVIKTRLQTQVPGLSAKYNGVGHALTTILAEEGISGLYRGVGPRLFIYVSQGAIFFASYEFARKLLSTAVWPLATNQATERLSAYAREVVKEEEWIRTSMRRKEGGVARVKLRSRDKG
ncbi:hypothetical protein CBR_g32117 [Chara braunii]|uniref:Mitochondrial carrier protein n=1 Tax=Chara braunii TaxID=69332 RepID=A0A388LGI6_CHABU|nr:hypothetical protein CBR_g32117 [Chara braunii]|eukprot:GBG81440.1 hypothetical protein CBR_g32117 [Chara braunii]